MNPKDIMTDAIHNFHPQYQQYTQYQSGDQSGSGEKGTSSGAGGSSDGHSGKAESSGSISSKSKDNGPSELAATVVGNIVNLSTSSEDSNKKSSSQTARGIKGQKFSEKSGLLSSDDEFQ